MSVQVSAPVPTTVSRTTPMKISAVSAPAMSWPTGAGTSAPDERTAASSSNPRSAPMK